jgi:FKBP-type peptidyl-prolyl cis-trans isomerase SlyD
MKIAKDSVVTLRFTVADASGKLLDKGSEPMAYLHGGYGNTIPKIEEALEGQETGFATTLSLAPADAFGERDEALVRSIPKSEFPPGVKVGGQLRGTNDEGGEQVYRVVKIKGPEVLLDGNHALAGQALRFGLKVEGVRAATAEELAHGHVHGEHGHQH